MHQLNRRQLVSGFAIGSLGLSAIQPKILGSQNADAALVWSWGNSGIPNPFRVSAAGPGGAILISLIYDTLTWKDESGIIPWLASEWSTDAAGIVYTFEIVSGAVWHDGTPLTAADVAFSFGYYANFPYAWMRSDIVSTAVADGNSVKITLMQPYAAFIEDIAGIVPIIPRHVWETVTDPVTYDGVGITLGSGPYQLAEFSDTEGAYRFTANPSYWNGIAAYTEIRQIAVPAEALIESVRAAEVDLASSSDASIRDVLADDSRLEIYESAPLSIVRLAINTRVAPLDRREVRQAICYALDRMMIAESITRGPAIIGSSGVVPPETPWYNPNLIQYEFNPQRARELLAGEQLTLNLVADTNAREPDLMVTMLADVGITLNIQRVDGPTRIQLLRDGDYELGFLTHIGVGGDPDYLRRWYSGEETNAYAQGSVFTNADYTRIGAEQAATLDPELRKELVFQMQDILAEELPTIVLYHRRFYWMHDPARFTPMATWGGLMNGIPFPHNKLALLAP